MFMLRKCYTYMYILLKTQYKICVIVHNSFFYCIKKCRCTAPHVSYIQCIYILITSVADPDPYHLAGSGSESGNVDVDPNGS